VGRAGYARASFSALPRATGALTGTGHDRLASLRHLLIGAHGCLCAARVSLYTRFFFTLLPNCSLKRTVANGCGSSVTLLSHGRLAQALGRKERFLFWWRCSPRFGSVFALAVRPSFARLVRPAPGPQIRARNRRRGSRANRRKACASCARCWCSTRESVAAHRLVWRGSVSASQAIAVARCCGVFVAALLSSQGRTLGAA
jgi:hypothetical protein